MNITQLKADTFHLERNMAWKYVFHDKDEASNSAPTKTPFDKKRTKDNMPKHYPEGISSFCDAVRSELMGAQHKKVSKNLDEAESKALEELDILQKEGKIVLQPADKNGGICVMNRNDYIIFMKLRDS